jgi:hypothetical protein
LIPIDANDFISRKSYREHPSREGEMNNMARKRAKKAARAATRVRPAKQMRIVDLMVAALTKTEAAKCRRNGSAHRLYSCGAGSGEAGTKICVAALEGSLKALVSVLRTKV